MNQSTNFFLNAIKLCVLNQFQKCSLSPLWLLEKRESLELDLTQINEMFTLPSFVREFRSLVQETKATLQKDKKLVNKWASSHIENYVRFQKMHGFVFLKFFRLLTCFSNDLSLTEIYFKVLRIEDFGKTNEKGNFFEITFFIIFFKKSKKKDLKRSEFVDEYCKGRLRVFKNDLVVLFQKSCKKLQAETFQEILGRMKEVLSSTKDWRSGFEEPRKFFEGIISSIEMISKSAADPMKREKIDKSKERVKKKIGAMKKRKLQMEEALKKVGSEKESVSDVVDLSLEVEALISNIVSQIVEKHLLGLGTKCLNEIFSCGSREMVQAHLDPSIKDIVSFDLKNPKQFFTCECCKDSPNEDVTVCFNIFQRSDNLVNVYDWFANFCDIIIEKIGKDCPPPSSEDLQARFFFSLKQLKMLGLFKETKRKKNHVVKVKHLL